MQRRLYATSADPERQRFTYPRDSLSAYAVPVATGETVFGKFSGL